MTGAPLTGQALAVPATPASGLDAPRCDPSRVAFTDALAAELLHPSRGLARGILQATPDSDGKIMPTRAGELRKATHCIQRLKDERDIAIAIAMEARRAETGAGSVHDSAAIAQPSSPPSPNMGEEQSS